MADNPVYRGLIEHRDKTWPGTHAAIIDDALWDRVQEKLQCASARRRGQVGPRSSSAGTDTSAPLLGKLRYETGERLTPSHTNRHGKRFRYYVSNRLITGKRQTKGWRLSAKVGWGAAVLNGSQGKASTRSGMGKPVMSRVACTTASRFGPVPRTHHEGPRR
ncbi:recombinase family protein [Cribrihabitans marinus]|uniref:recombinase family protein n=1 Tax=Cribrihabitans marinus TaxID=1227549 RepID=UPI0019A545D3|nr:hypothetical protein GCM10010973_05680 [Cribrihabitans marinus]